MTATVVSLYTEIMESGRYDFQIITFRRFRKETFIAEIHAPAPMHGCVRWRSLQNILINILTLLVQPICTVSIDIEPPSNPSTGKRIVSPSLRRAIT